MGYWAMGCGWVGVGARANSARPIFALWEIRVLVSDIRFSALGYGTPTALLRSWPSRVTLPAVRRPLSAGYKRL
jgi:hypothetical protein